MDIDNIITSNSLIAPVPEPATWMMILFGFGLIGISMRRRQTVAAAWTTSAGK